MLMQDETLQTFCTPHFCLAFVLCNGYSVEQSSAAHLQRWFGVANLASHVLPDIITYCTRKELLPLTYFIE
jgi:hypothetical protein